MVKITPFFRNAFETIQKIRFETRVLRKITTADVVSFDIFDTVIIRKIARPTDVFRLVEDVYQSRFGECPFDFSEEREISEAEARNIYFSQNGSHEINMDEIYKVLVERIGDIFSAEIDILKQIERETELKVCVRNEYIYRFYEIAKKKKKRVIFTTDTYFPREIIEQILIRGGYVIRPEDLYISSERRISKADTLMFRKISEIEEVDFPKIMHLGDNLFSDFIYPASLGIQAVQYRKPLSNFLKQNGNFFGKKLPDSEQNLDFTVTESIIAGLTIRRYYCDPAFSKRKAVFFDRMGYEVSGVLFFSFISWLIQDLKRSGIERVYFLGRDGFFLEKLYSLRTKDKEISGSYLFASRRAFLFPTIKKIDQYAIQSILAGARRIKICDFVMHFRIKKNQIRMAAKEASLPFYRSFFVSLRYPRLITLLFRLEEEILSEVKQEKEALHDFLDREGVFLDRKIGFVDIGWSGTIIHALYNNFPTLLSKKNCTAYFFGTWQSVLSGGSCLNRKNTKGYLFNIGKPKIVAETVRSSTEILEYFLSAPYGSLVRFENDDARGAIPVFASSDTRIEKIEYEIRRVSIMPCLISPKTLT